MFWKPGEPLPPVDANLAAHINLAPYNPQRHLPIQEQRRRLPIWSHRLSFVYAVEHYRVVLLVGSTGCGKSTQIPQFLREAGWTKERMTIVITSPRRLACAATATRVAEEMNEDIGHTVGYSIQFDHNVAPKECEIIYMTDELLVKEMLSDPLLTKYSVIVLDDAHDRTLCTEVLLPLLRKILTRRPRLRLVIASATVNAELFASYFQKVIDVDENEIPRKRMRGWDCDKTQWEEVQKSNVEWRNVVSCEGDQAVKDVYIMAIEGRLHPVKIRYLTEPTPDYLKACVDTVMYIHRTEPQSGDILVFVTGVEEVYDVLHAIQDRTEEKSKAKLRLHCVPLFAFLPKREQYAAFAQGNRTSERKVVISTNVAETAVTIPGVRYVVDCCLAKIEAFDPKTGTTHFEVSAASQATLHQRAGRAGRVESGVCYRLLRQPDFDKLPTQSVPEILRSNLAHFVLQLKCLGVDQVAAFDFISKPSTTAFERALEDLFLLGAIDDEAKLIDPLGLQMASCPLTPLWSKLVLTSPEFKCGSEICLIAAMAQVHSPFISHTRNKARLLAARESLGVFEGDLVSLLNVARQFEYYLQEDPGWADKFFLNKGVIQRALQVAAHLEAFLKSHGHDSVSCGLDVESLQKCICHSWYLQAAKRCNDGSYLPLRNGGRSYKLHPNSMLAGLSADCPEYVVYEQTVAWNDQYFMKNVTKVDVQWLADAAPHFYKER